MRNLSINTFLISVAFATQTVLAIDYPYQTAEPQKTGWPLTAEERAYVVDKAEHDRRPGRESNKHLHLNVAGYEVLASRMKPLIESHLKNN